MDILISTKIETMDRVLHTSVILDCGEHGIYESSCCSPKIQMGVVTTTPHILLLCLSGKQIPWFSGMKADSGAESCLVYYS